MVRVRISRPNSRYDSAFRPQSLFYHHGRKRVYFLACGRDSIIIRDKKTQSFFWLSDGFVDEIGRKVAVCPALFRDRVVAIVRRYAAVGFFGIFIHFPRNLFNCFWTIYCGNRFIGHGHPDGKGPETVSLNY